MNGMAWWWVSLHICYNKKQQNAHNFVCLFGFFLPPKFPSGAFVVWEAIQKRMSGMMGVLQFATKWSNKMLTTFFVCLVFFLPPKFPSGAFVVWGAIQNQWVAWWVSYNLLQNEATKCSQLSFFLSLWFFLPQISIVELVVWEWASHKHF